MNKRWMKKSSLVMAVMMVLSLMVSSASMADDSMVEVRRDNVGNQVLAYSPTVSSLELGLISISRSYMSYKDSMESFEDIYNNLGTYQTLDSLYSQLSSDYRTYMGLVSSGDVDNMSLAASMIDGDVVDPDAADPNDPDGNGLSNEEEEALAAEVESFPLATYTSYIILKAQFSAFGFSSPSISNREEYETFVYPIEVVPLAFQNSAKLLGVTIEQTKAGIKAGAEGVFDGAVMLEGIEAMLAISYELSEDALVTATKKYELGQLSEVAYKQAINDAQIAKLEYDSIQREVENMTMRLNWMLGQELSTPLVLVSDAGQTQTLQPLQAYIESALEARAEIKNNAFNEDYAEDQLYYVDKYLRNSAIERRRLDHELEDLELEADYAVKAISADVQKAYMAVLDQAEFYRISQLTMKDAIRQQSDMALNVELGYVTASTARAVDLLVTQSTNDYHTAYRDYMTALSALEVASGIGTNMSGY